MNNTGKAVVCAIGAMTLTGGIVSTTNAAAPQSVSVNRTADIAYAKDGNGDTMSAVVANKKSEQTITVIPYAASAATAAAAALDAWNVGAGVVVTIVDSVTSTSDGTWMTTATRASRTNEGIAAVDIDLIKFDVNDITTATT